MYDNLNNNINNNNIKNEVLNFIYQIIINQNIFVLYTIYFMI